MVKLTQKSFDELVEALNHRMTKLEISVRWMKWIMGYIAVLMTGIFVKAIIL